MSEFNVNQYWLKRGATYAGEERLGSDCYRMQERFLLDVLRKGGLPMRKILELGCGFGRITRLLAEEFSRAQISALDLSEDQLANARKVCAGHENISFGRYDFYSGAPFPGNDFDTAIAIEVFLHHPPELVLELFRRLATSARFIVNIDWSENWQWAMPEHVWMHDYRRLYQQAGLQCAVFTVPEKVDGLQHQLFVGGRELIPELLDLERTSHKDDVPIASVAPVPAAAAGAQWLRQLHGAARNILSVVPRECVLILVDDNTWGNAQRLLPERRVLPFLERDGEYWGPPPDDPTAILELERMRAAGARYLAVAWNSFWWLHHYREFHQHLRRCGRCVLVSDDVMVFEL